MAPRVLTQKSIFFWDPAVTKTFDAPESKESWIPEIETAEAPACQRTDCPDLNPPTKWSAWVAVIQVYISSACLLSFVGVE